jgi:resuscitation-promoting factor RpfB
VQPSPARAEADGASWLPVPEPETLPSVEELLTAAPPEPDEARDIPIAAPGPGRAEAHDETAWLPLPDLEDLPSIEQMLDPASSAAARDVDIPAEPSPARAAPADATAWLPLPDLADLPEITELVDPDRGAGVSPPAAAPRRRRRLHLPSRELVLRTFLLLLVVATLAGGYYGATRVLDAGDDVQIRADGRVLSTETGVSTVGGVLAEQHIKLGDYDRSIPPVGARVRDGMSVKVLRAFRVDADVDGSPRTLYSTHRAAAPFVRDAAAQIGVPAQKLALRDDPVSITPNSTVVLRTKRQGTLLVDGSSVNYDSPSLTIGELLQSYNVKLNPADIIKLTQSGETVGSDADLPDNDTVEIVRVAAATDRRLEPYDLPDETRPDPNLNVGDTRVQERVTGTRWVTYTLDLRDGQEVGRTAVSAVPVKRARPHIDFFGTKYNPIWDKMAQCETNGNWQAPGPEWQGGLGIYFQNWEHYGGLAFAPTADQATKYQQIIVAERIRADHGWHAWGCAERIGL